LRISGEDLVTVDRKYKDAKFTNQVHHLITVVQWEETTASSILTSVLN